MQDQSQLSPEDIQLIQIASEHAKKRFKDGFTSIAAALRTKNGKIYTGTNTKYHVRNLSMCAEMLAIYKALDDGESEFDTVVGVRYIPESDSFEVVNGCGKCRQLFCTHTPINVIADENGTLKKVTAETLLPFAFI